MKVLHLYANHKWTGPAELALQQVWALNAAGACRAELALAGHQDPARPHAIAERCRQLDLPVREGMALRRHFHLPALLADARRLAGWLDAGEYDLLHCHQGGDHLAASLALGFAHRRVPLVRSYWENRVPGRGPRPWLAFRGTGRVLAPFASLAEELRRRFPYLDDRVEVMSPVLGPKPDPEPEDFHRARAALRDELSLGPEAFLVGLTARIQPHRRWDLAWDVLDRMSRRRPDVHLCVLGRPDEGVFDRLCRQPLAERGITHRVHFLGYRRGAGYREALQAFDAFLFLVPGSDATCRALREAMATGLPAVTTDLGRLPEIVTRDETGLRAPAEPEALARALETLFDDAHLRERLGRAARRFAAAHWSPEIAADCLGRVYGALRTG